MIPLEPASWEPARAGARLDTDSLDIWRAQADLDGCAGAISGLEPEERARAEQMRSPLRQAQFAVGHALVNKIRAQHGPPLFTSLSHSGQWILAAAARKGPVGVDVESLRTDRPLAQLSRRFFTPQEHAWLGQFSAEQQALPFYALWTAKEALFKALGTAPGGPHFAARPVLASINDNILHQTLIVEGCRVGWFAAAPGYLGAFAVPAPVAHLHLLLSEK